MAWGLIVLPTSNCYSSQLSRIVLLGLYVLHESSSVWQSDTWFCWFSVVWDVLSSAVSGSGAGSFCCLLCKFLDISPAVHLPLNAVHEPPFNFFCGQRTSNLFSDHNILVFYVPWNNHLLFGVLIVADSSCCCVGSIGNFFGSAFNLFGLLSIVSSVFFFLATVSIVLSILKFLNQISVCLRYKTFSIHLLWADYLYLNIYRYLPIALIAPLRKRSRS